MTKIMLPLGFIGAGNMGEAFIGALTKTGLCQPSNILISDIDKARLNLIKSSFGVQIAPDNRHVFDACRTVVLAVKPQQMETVLCELAKALAAQTDRKLIISIAAGYRIQKMEQLLYHSLNDDHQKKLPLIRVMPNTPALVLSGMTGLSSNRYATAEDITAARTLLQAMGKVLEFEEQDLDAVTAVSGSGPAYVFYLIEAMIEAGLQLNLNPQNARELTLETLKGAVALMEQRGESAESLRRKVTSPGGTTEAALRVIERHRVKQTIIEAILAAADRSRQLSG